MAYREPLGYMDGPFVVTKSDTTVYNPPLNSFYIGGTGNVTLVMNNDDSVLFTAPAVGVIHFVAGIKKIMSTGTTATAILAGR